MGKCGSKAKKMDANDVPYGMKEEIKRDEIDEDKDCILRQQDDKYLNDVEERTGIVLNIVADRVSIGSSGDMLKFKDDIFQNRNIDDIRTKVCKQEPLKEIYMPTDECTDGPIVTSSKALNLEPFNAEKENNKLCKEETETPELICTTGKHDLGDSQLADTKSNNEPSKTVNLTDERASSSKTMTEKPTTGSTLQKQTGTSSSHGSSTDASSCQTMTEKPKTGSTLQKQTGTSSSHGSSTDASSCQTMTEKHKTGSTLLKQTGTSSSHGSLTGSLEQDGSDLSGLSHLLSGGSNDSTMQCNINRCSSPTNDVDKLKDYTIVSKRSDFESSTSSQLFRPSMTSITTEGLLRSSENSPFTEQLDRTCHASNKQQMDNSLKLNKAPLSSYVHTFITEINTNSDENMSRVTPRVAEQQLASSHYTPSNNELTNMSDITPGTSSNVPENNGTVVEENQFQSTNQSSVTQAGEDQGEEHQEQENQAVEMDSEPDIRDGIFVGNNNDLNDQQLKEKSSSYLMKAIDRIAIDVGQHSMNQNYAIAMAGNDEVKIKNGIAIGDTACIASKTIGNVAIAAIKSKKSF